MDLYKEQIIVGSLFGDGHIECRYKTPIYKETHSIKQKEYALWKAEILDCSYRIRLHSKTRPVYEIDIFKAGKEFLKYYHLFYSSKKTFTEQALSLLNPEGIAVWYCDDGCYVYGLDCCFISTMCPLEEKIIIKQFFESRGLSPILFKTRIYFNKTETKKFVDMIKPFVPECMNYKLGTNIQKSILQRKKVNAYSMASYYKHKDKRLSYRRKYRNENRKKVREGKKRFYLKHRNDILIKQKEYRRNNLEKVRQTRIRYYQKNKEKLLNKCKEWRKENLHRFRAYNKKAYRKKHPFKEKKCPICGNLFFPSENNHQVYCSIKCEPIKIK